MPTIKDALDIIGKLTVAEQESLKTMLWGNHFWSPSYCVVSCGGVALDVVREYINNQNDPPSEKAMKTSQALKQRKE